MKRENGAKNSMQTGVQPFGLTQMVLGGVVAAAPWSCKAAAARGLAQPGSNNHVLGLLHIPLPTHSIALHERDNRRSAWNKSFLLTSFSLGHQRCTWSLPRSPDPKVLTPFRAQQTETHQDQSWRTCFQPYARSWKPEKQQQLRKRFMKIILQCLDKNPFRMMLHSAQAQLGDGQRRVTLAFT